MWTIILGIVAIVLLVSYLTGKRPPNTPPVINSIPLLGEGISFSRDALGTIRNAYEKYGDIFTLKVFWFNMTYLIGPDAHDVFFRANDEELSPREAYQFVVPVFGPGIVYDAPIPVMIEQIAMVKSGLRLDAFKKNVPIMQKEAIEFFSQWGDNGEVEFLSTLNRLTILTASRCLLGDEIRSNPKVAEEFAGLYHDLEGGLNPLAFFFPYLPIPAHKKRDEARVKIKELFSRVIKMRRQTMDSGSTPDDMLQVLMDSKYKNGRNLSDDEITGILIGLLFAGQHTSGITATWTGFFLTQNPDILKECIEEQKEVIKEFGSNITFDVLHQKKTPRLETCVRETLRMFPPLIILMRKAKKDLSYKNYTIPAGDLVCIAPGAAMRLESVFPDANTWNPKRWDKDFEKPYSFVAFGGGKHGCPGERFGILQIKTFWSYLLRNFEFEAVGKFPVPDYTNLVVGPAHPAMMRYKRRAVPLDKM